MSSQSPSVYWRVRWASFGAVLALALVGLAWLLVTAVKSPQDALASATPPPPSRITVPVEERVLDLTVTVIARLVSPDRVQGKLGVGDRDRAEDAERILVTGSGAETPADLAKIEPNGDFVVRLRTPLQDMADDTVRVDFEPARQGTQGLVVPISALFTSAAGGTAVVVVEDDQDHEVAVQTGDEVAGFVAIVPIDEGSLAAGDEVLVSEPPS